LPSATSPPAPPSSATAFPAGPRSRRPAARPSRSWPGKRAAGSAPFRWVNTALGNIKTAITGTYHHVSPKHAQQDLTCCAYRFNRRYQLDSIVERLAGAAVPTVPQPYRTLTADG
jgi:hypothetical protein